MPSTALAVASLCLGFLLALHAADDTGPVTGQAAKGKDTVLSQSQRAQFVQLVSGWHYRSEIYKYPAAPIAQFTHAGKHYSMHGNALTLMVDKDTEWLWIGPWSQALIVALGETDYDLGAALARIEGKDLTGVLMDPPDAYPGGGPAPLLNQHREGK
jgi:hypothetical protein